jgi:hypothetical protein
MKASGSTRFHPIPLPRRFLHRDRNGFALVVALLMMMLLSVLAIGLLSLANISLRGSSVGDARRVAQANARVALAMALGQLQAELGDDRRVTADGAILGTATSQQQLVGVWESAAGTQLTTPTAAAPDYDSWKRSKFRTWLTSSPDPDELRVREYAQQPVSDESVKLFVEKADGFDMRALTIPVAEDNGLSGNMAWAVTQEATKAKINVGSDLARIKYNDAIHAPDGPKLGLSDLAKQPKEGWSQRSGRVLGMNQAILDGEYALSRETSAELRREHTAHARGVLADVVNGGLKTDLSLGFNLGDGAFAQSRWGQVTNPFSGGTAPRGEVPLYQPLNNGTPVTVSMNYGTVRYDHVFETGASPTFHSLRSHYNLFQHLYSSAGGTAAFYRPQASAYWPDSPRGSETSVAPVLDRVLFFICLYVDPGGFINVVFTPVITLWNPYNVSVESEGFVVFPWMDIPMFANFNVSGANYGTIMSWNMGIDSLNRQEGRQKEPYFYCKLTGSGTDNLSTPIRIGPGEVRVFIPATKDVIRYDRKQPEATRTSIYMRPASSAADIDIGGGIGVPMNVSMGTPITKTVSNADSLSARLDFQFSSYHYFVRMEDSGRMKGLTRGKTVSEVQIYNGKMGNQSVETPTLTGTALKQKPRPVAILETFHRTAGESGQMADLVYTVNPRQRYVNAMISGSSTFVAGPHYESSMHKVSDFISEAFQVTGDGQRSYYGMSNAAGSGRDYLPFFEIPKEPMLSLGAFQNADLSDSAYSPGSQFGNAWASGFVSRTTAARSLKTATTSGAEKISPNGLGIYDSSYLLNAAVWDGYYFSAIAPRTTPASSGGSSSVYNNTIARTTQGTADIIRNWVEAPESNPLRNPRHLFHRGGMTDDQIVGRLDSSAGCRWAAAHMLVDGAFNVNSVNEAAWCAMLASLRGSKLEVTGKGAHDSGNSTPVPRLREPSGNPGDLWNGFRELSDDQIRTLASEIVREVRDRGPFQSMGEFVNRRLASTSLGLKGALQAAIDRANLNSHATVERFNNTGYPFRSNLPEPFTGTGTPGWLTQADLLTALGPFITVRSDTFTIRAYGEAKDTEGKVLARSWCEAVVQRVPDLLDPDPNDNATERPLDLTPINARFGRRFEIISFRDISEEELAA